ncbi:MAG TPA: FliG C-terminal domain-containing protein [Armatimonadota bacterium]|nr:FliG C-terminal domain-containing protein [Armatimonadota bacterium]
MAQLALTKTQKIATLLVTLGTERSARILEYLEPDQIARITREIAGLGNVSPQTKRAVLTEFRALLTAQEQQTKGLLFGAGLLDKTLGIGKTTVMRKTRKPSVPTEQDYLTTIPPQQAADLIASEPVPIIARLLIVLPADTSAAILNYLPAELQTRVALQLASTPPPSADMRANLERAIRSKAERHVFSTPPQQQHEIPMDESPAQMETPDVSDSTVTQASPNDTDAAPPSSPSVKLSPAALPSHEFAFEDLNMLSMPKLQELVGQIGNRDLGLALRGTDIILRDRIIEALPFGRRVTLQARLKSRSAVSLRMIAESQERILLLAQSQLMQERSEEGFAREHLHV